MTNLKNIPSYILEDAAQDLGWREYACGKDYNPDDDPIETYLSQTEDMSPEEIFKLYCNWHGLSGYSLETWLN